MKIAMIAPMLLNNSEEIENIPAPQRVGIYPPMIEPTKAARYTKFLEDIHTFYHQRPCYISWVHQLRFTD